MEASVPLMVSPAIVTVLPVPTVLSLNVAVAVEVESVTTSLPCLPTSAADPRTSWFVATLVASYVRLLAVMPDTVSSFAVILAEVVGWVSV